MKKIILFLIVAVFLISGCAKEAVVEEEEDEVKFPTVSEQDIDEEEEELNIVDVEAVKKAVASELSEDVKELLKTRTNFRICKGIYVEHRDIAYKDYEIVNSNFALLLEIALKSRCYVGIATHDEKVVWHGLRLVHQLGLSHDEYEFQMLLGVDEQLRRILLEEGHRLRVYVPYGKNWYAYSMRRLKENPRIAFYIIKAILGFK